YKVKILKTEYWRPNHNYINSIINSIRKFVKDGDIIVISEKALCAAEGRIIDESKIKPRLLAKVIARFWMRYVWGYILSKLCHQKPLTIQRLRNYPKEAEAHKQLALGYSGLLQALRHGSEGGIDVSNLPYSYACLPLPNPNQKAEELRKIISESLNKKITIMIVDTDMTYSWRNLHFTPRPNAIKGILSGWGVITYVVCRALKMRARATPLAIAGERLSVEEALNIAELAHHARKSGAGKTVWDMAESFQVGLTDVTWEMLESVKHYPIVIVRRKSKLGNGAK
ncbi:MAG: coenzyme F420-0:L-glutamate ligase, partial [Nitrososphaerales archaeon]